MLIKEDIEQSGYRTKRKEAINLFTIYDPQSCKSRRVVINYRVDRVDRVVTYSFSSNSTSIIVSA